MLQNLSLTINTFSELRKQNCVYVDKTPYVHRLLTTAGSTQYFLSRPRRFGKSLLVSTLEETLHGNKELFEGLRIASSDYTWKKHAVISLDFSKAKASSKANFNNSLCQFLKEIAKQYQVKIASFKFASDALDSLVIRLHEKYGAVAVLIDEYDRPLLHNLTKPDIADDIREEMSDFFSTIKGNDRFINFVFITGVTAFTKAGIFSGINNLNIVSLDAEYSAICGYTDEEVDKNFSGHIQAWADQEDISYKQMRTQIKEWYNGYQFSKQASSVYNPFSIGYALSKKEFENYWFKSGTPTFLINMIKERSEDFDPTDLQATDLLGSFDITDIPINILMFQAGYLTIRSYDPQSEMYTLDYPNMEVKKYLQPYLLEALAHIKMPRAKKLAVNLYTALATKKLTDAIRILQQLFAHIPYQLHIDKESYYRALLQMVLITADINSHAEYSIDAGRIDVVVELPKIIYVMEIKFNKAALAQIRKSKYYQAFVRLKKPIVLVGINFERKPRSFKISYMQEEL